VNVTLDIRVGTQMASFFKLTIVVAD